MPKLKFLLVAFLCTGRLLAVEKILKMPPKKILPVPMDVFNFDHDKPGGPPKQFAFVTSGAGPDVTWEVKADHLAPSAPNVLVQEGKAELGGRLALALLDGRMLQDGEISVQFKVVKGDDDQTAAIVWRCKDPQTYYVAMADAQDDSCSVYRIKKGKRKLLDTESFIISPYTWHELHVIFVKNSYSVFVDQEPVVAGKDSGLPDAGRVGVGTLGDAQLAFDDFRATR
jgi:hypothetical protein